LLGRGRGARGKKRKRIDAASSGCSELRCQAKAGLPHAIAQAKLIIDLLLRAVLRLTTWTKTGKPVLSAARADWIARLL